MALAALPGTAALACGRVAETIIESVCDLTNPNSLSVVYKQQAETMLLAAEIAISGDVAQETVAALVEVRKRKDCAVECYKRTMAELHDEEQTLKKHF